MCRHAKEANTMADNDKGYAIELTENEHDLL